MRCCYINSSFPAKKRLKTRKTTAKKTYVQQHNNNNNTHTRIRTTHTTSALCSISSAAQRFVNDPSVCPSTLIFLLHFVFVLIYFSFFGVLFIFFIIFRGKKEINWIGGTACLLQTSERGRDDVVALLIKLNNHYWNNGKVTVCVFSNWFCIFFYYSILTRSIDNHLFFCFVKNECSLYILNILVGTYFLQLDLLHICLDYKLLEKVLKFRQNQHRTSPFF